jgi:hypothetical protein
MKEATEQGQEMLQNIARNATAVTRAKTAVKRLLQVLEQFPKESVPSAEQVGS